MAKAETQGFQNWGSSERAWKFNPESAPTGYTIAEMKQHYEQQRDKSLLHFDFKAEFEFVILSP